jgi:hypothetical protein
MLTFIGCQNLKIVSKKRALVSLKSLLVLFFVANVSIFPILHHVLLVWSAFLLAFIELYQFLISALL